MVGWVQEFPEPYQHLACDRAGDDLTYGLRLGWSLGPGRSGGLKTGRKENAHVILTVRFDAVSELDDELHHNFFLMLLLRELFLAAILGCGIDGDEGVRLLFERPPDRPAAQARP